LDKSKALPATLLLAAARTLRAACGRLSRSARIRSQRHCVAQVLNGCRATQPRSSKWRVWCSREEGLFQRSQRGRKMDRNLPVAATW